MGRISTDETNEVAELEESLSAVAEELRELRAEVLRRGTMIRDMGVRMKAMIPDAQVISPAADPGQASLALQVAQLRQNKKEEVSSLEKSIETKDALITRLQLELAEVQRHDAEYRMQLERLHAENQELRAAVSDAAHAMPAQPEELLKAWQNQRKLLQELMQRLAQMLLDQPVTAPPHEISNGSEDATAR